MRAETLHRITLDIFNDIRETDSLEKLEGLVNALDRQLKSPSETEEAIVREAREELKQALGRSIFNDLAPAEQEILSGMGVNALLGNALLPRVDEAFTGTLMTPALALERLKELLDELRRLYNKTDEITDAFLYFDIEQDELDPGEFEVMIGIPGVAVDCELGQFGREALRLNQIVGVFSEIVTGSREPAKIRALSSSDLTIFLESLPAVAAVLAVAIERIAALYERVLNIITLHRDLKSFNVPEKVLEPLKEHIDQEVQRGLDDLAKNIEKEHFKHVEQTRRQELGTELRRALRDLANRVDHGYIFDVRGQDLAPGVDNADNLGSPAGRAIAKALRIVEEVRPRLRHFEPEGEPILGLPEPGNDNSGDPE